MPAVDVVGVLVEDVGEAPRAGEVVGQRVVALLGRDGQGGGGAVRPEGQVDGQQGGRVGRILLLGCKGGDYCDGLFHLSRREQVELDLDVGGDDVQPLGRRAAESCTDKALTLSRVYKHAVDAAE